MVAARELAKDAIRAIIPSQPSALDFEGAEARLLPLPQVDCPLRHRFAPGVYLREITMPAGTFVIGAEHNTQHFNIVLSGKALVMIDGELHEIIGPCTFVSMAGVRKVLYILEDMLWQTVHPTEETDVPTLERTLVNRTATAERHLRDMEMLKKRLNQENP